MNPMLKYALPLAGAFVGYTVQKYYSQNKSQPEIASSSSAKTAEVGTTTLSQKKNEYTHTRYANYHGR